MFTDFVLNGRGNGSVGEILQGTRFDAGLMRPYLNDKGMPTVTVNTGRMLFNNKTGQHEPTYAAMSVLNAQRQGLASAAMNAVTSLRKDEWLQLDTVVLQAARQRLKAWSDLLSANTFGGFNGMSKMLLEHETVSDGGEAIVDMDGLSEGRGDSPIVQLEGLPLPITHASFSFAQRRLAVSRNSGTPLDTTQAAHAGRRVAEQIEKTLIGEVTGLSYGNTADYGRAPTVYGYTNFPNRVTKTDMTTPTGSNGPAVLTSFLALRELMYAGNFYGPYMVYVSSDYDQHLDNLFSSTEPSAGTLRSRLKEIDGIRDIRRLDYLTGTYQVLFVQMTPDVARAVVGMPITTMRWESKGGLQEHYKVMTIQVPQLRADFNGNCGIGHGTTA